MQLNALHKGNKKHLIFTGIMSVVFLLAFVIELKILLVLLFVIGSGFLALAYHDFEIRPVQLLVLLFFITIFAPLIQLTDSIPAIRPEQFLFFSVFPALFLLQDRDTYPALNRFIKFFIGFQCLQAFSLLYGKVGMGTAIGYKDFVEIIRVTEYGLAAFVIGHFAITQKEIKAILYLLILFIAGSAVIGVFQYYGILGLDRLTAPLYFEGRIHDVHNRLMGTFVNPNTYGTFAAFGAIITLGTLFFEKAKKLKVLLFFVFLLLVWSVALTQSRTSYIVFFAGLISLIGIYGYSRKLKWYTILTILIGLLILLGGIGFLLSEQIIRRFESLLTFMDDPSWQMRLFAWYINFHLFLQSPLFGWGPTLHEFSPIADSDYFLIIRRYGIVGFLSFLSLFIVPAFYALKNLQNSNFAGLFSKIFLACVIMFLIGNIPNTLFHEKQFMSFWSLLLGLLYAVNRNTKE